MKRIWFNCVVVLLSLIVVSAVDRGGAEQKLSPAANIPKVVTSPPPIPLTDSERQWIKEHPTVYWGADPNWPPFSSLDKKGKITGIDVEVMRLVAERTGLNIALVPTSSWTETLEKVRQHEIDFTSGTSLNENRLTDFNFTVPYCTFPIAIITRKELGFLTSVQQLSTNRVATPKDYITTEQLQHDYPDTQFIFTDTVEQGLEMVAAGDADAIIVNLATASYLVYLRGYTNLKISGLARYSFPLRLAIRKDLPELAAILDKAVHSIGDSEMERINAKYIEPQVIASASWARWKRRTLYAVASGVVAVIIFLAWNRKMAKEIAIRTKVENDLRDAQQSLKQQADELKLRVAEVERLNQKLVTANKDLESFSYSVSHDLRAPLRHVASFSEMLGEDTETSFSDDAKQYLKTIERESQRMQQMIDALLTFARIGRVEMAETAIDLNEIVKETIHDLEPETAGRDVLWKTAPLPSVKGDQKLIRQVFANLLENAVKFTRQRSRAEIEIAAMPATPGDREVVFYVRDNGAGFDMVQVGKLFGVFQRLHHAHDFEGTGIGLANVQRIIHRHGGRIWAEGERDKGATFYFSLPRA